MYDMLTISELNQTDEYIKQILRIRKIRYETNVKFFCIIITYYIICF